MRQHSNSSSTFVLLGFTSYFGRLNPAVSHKQYPCQDHSAGTSAHELSTALAFVQGLPERVGWSLDINIVHEVAQQWNVFDQGQPIGGLRNLQPVDHEMYALLAMFGMFCPWSTFNVDLQSKYSSMSRYCVRPGRRNGLLGVVLEDRV